MLLLQHLRLTLDLHQTCECQVTRVYTRSFCGAVLPPGSFLYIPLVWRVESDVINYTVFKN